MIFLKKNYGNKYMILLINKAQIIVLYFSKTIFFIKIIKFNAFIFLYVYI